MMARFISKWWHTRSTRDRRIAMQNIQTASYDHKNKQRMMSKCDITKYTIVECAIMRSDWCHSHSNAYASKAKNRTIEKLVQTMYSGPPKYFRVWFKTFLSVYIPGGIRMHALMSATVPHPNPQNGHVVHWNNELFLKSQGRSNRSRVIGIAVGTFVPNNVKQHFSGIVAVIAQDPDLQNTRHRVKSGECKQRRQKKESR